MHLVVREAGVAKSPEQERWAEALKIEQMLGDAAPLWIAERIGYLARAGDVAGVARFKAIAACFEQLLTNPDRTAPY